MGYRPVNQTVVGPAPIVIETNADVRIGQVGRKGVAIDQKSARGQCLEQPLTMFEVTSEGEIKFAV